MKKIALLLAFYILALSAMPCNDIHAIAIDSTDTGVTLQSHEDEHEHHMDLCSPFCSCDCCQTVAETVNQIQTQIENSFFSADVAPCFHTEIESISSFWRPPIA
jgi:hypothetical protein